jgi:hypothetical protein
MFTVTPRLLAVALGVLVAALVATTLQTSSAAAATKTVRLVNKESGRALGAAFSGNIVAGINNPTISHQRWQRIEVGNGLVRYRNVRYGTCLDILGKSKSRGAALQLLPCDSSSTQLWTRGFSGGTFRELRNIGSSLSATVEEKTKVRQRFFTGAGNQLWSETAV